MAIASRTSAWEQAQQALISVIERVAQVPTDLIESYLAQALRTRGTVSILALVGLFWSASGVFTALYRAVNRAWGNPKAQLFWTEKLYGLAVVLVAGLLLVAVTVTITFVSVLQGWRAAVASWLPEILDSSGWLSSWVAMVAPGVVAILTFGLIYRTMPRNRVTWRDVWLGGLAAGLIWEAARQLFSWYLTNVARYSLVYGSVGVIIGFLLWSYLSAMIVLLGAEFTAQYSTWRRTGKPIESRPPSAWVSEWSKWQSP
jgi:membrane protein